MNCEGRAISPAGTSSASARWWTAHSIRIARLTAWPLSKKANSMAGAGSSATASSARRRGNNGSQPPTARLVAWGSTEWRARIARETLSDEPRDSGIAARTRSLQVYQRTHPLTVAGCVAEYACGAGHGSSSFREVGQDNPRSWVVESPPEESVGQEAPLVGDGSAGESRAPSAYRQCSFRSCNCRRRRRRHGLVG